MALDLITHSTYFAPSQCNPSKVDFSAVALKGQKKPSIVLPESTYLGNLLSTIEDGLSSALTTRADIDDFANRTITHYSQYIESLLYFSQTAQREDDYEFILSLIGCYLDLDIPLSVDFQQTFYRNFSHIAFPNNILFLENDEETAFENGVYDCEWHAAYQTEKSGNLLIDEVPEMLRCVSEAYCSSFSSDLGTDLRQEYQFIRIASIVSIAAYNIFSTQMYFFIHTHLSKVEEYLKFIKVHKRTLSPGENQKIDLIFSQIEDFLGQINPMAPHETEVIDLLREKFDSVELLYFSC